MTDGKRAEEAGGDAGVPYEADELGVGSGIGCEWGAASKAKEKEVPRRI